MKFIHTSPGKRFPQIGCIGDYPYSLSLRTNWLGCIYTTLHELNLKNYEPPPHTRFFDQSHYEKIVYWIVYHDLRDEVIFYSQYLTEEECEIKVIGFYSEKWLHMWLLTDFQFWNLPDS